MNALKIVAPALLCAVALASCGGGERSEPPVAEAPPPEPVEHTSTREYSPATFTANFWVSEELEQSDGSTARQRLGLGDLSPADRFDAPNGYESLTGACEVDRQRDVLIPGVLVVEDTTERFPVELDTGIYIKRPFHEGYGELGPETSIVQGFSSGPSCAAFDGNQTNAEVTFNLTAAETGRQRFLIVVHNYFSPGHPQGYAAGLRFLRVGFYPFLSYRGWEARCVSASAPLDGGFVRPDGKAINEQDYETYESTAYAYDSANVPSC